MRTVTRLAATGAALALVLPATAGTATADTVGTAPTRVLAGGATGLGNPTGVTRGPDGSWFVTNVATNSITVYAAGASGNAAPLRTIAGANTGLSSPYDIAVDPSGFTYVTSGASIRVFAPDATGNAFPVKVISGGATMLSTPVGLAVLGDGSVAVVNYSGNSVLRFAPTASGNAAPAATVAGPATGMSSPTDLAVTPSGRVYVANISGAVNVFNQLGGGNVAPSRTIGGLASGITSAYALALDGAENVYVSTFTQKKIVVFPAGASGNVAPRRVLTGASTQLNVPWGLYVGGDRQVTVADYSGNAINTYAPLVSQAVTAPSAVRSLSVGGRPSAKRRAIGWATPASNGGTPLLRYELVVKRGGKTVRSVRLTPSRHSYVLRAKGLKKGRYTVRVRAVNAKGAGPFAVASFRIRK